MRQGNLEHMSEELKSKPPYVAYVTFKNFLASMKTLVPARIDPTHPFMQGQSGSTQSYLMSALKFFGLVDGKAPTERLKKLAQSDGDERKSFWKSMFLEAYNPVVGDLDLTTATAGMIHEKLRDQGLSGETVQKCFSFFIAGADEAGIPLAPHLKPGARGKGGGNSGGGQKTRIKRRGNGTPASTTPESNKPQSLQAMLAAKFPDFNPEWSPEIQKQWFEGFERIWRSTEEKEGFSAGNKGEEA
jgi:hypothetical protein